MASLDFRPHTIARFVDRRGGATAPRRSRSRVPHGRVWFRRRLREAKARDELPKPLEPASVDQPSNEFEHMCPSSTLACRLRFAFDAFGKLLPACFAVPLLECFVRNLALDEEFGKFAPLGLALEWHDGLHLLSPLLALAVNGGRGAMLRFLHRRDKPPIRLLAT
jgi:hypothetical protein